MPGGQLCFKRALNSRLAKYSKVLYLRLPTIQEGPSVGYAQARHGDAMKTLGGVSSTLALNSMQR